MLKPPSTKRRAATLFLLLVTLTFGCVPQAWAHPLGNFTINHFARLEVGGDRVRVHYVVDMAEIPTFQELQALDTDRDGKPSVAELDAYLGRMAPLYAEALIVNVDGARVPLSVDAKTIKTVQGQGNLPTLRVECELSGAVASAGDGAAHQLKYEDTNYGNRIGWRELVVEPVGGVSVFDSSAYGSGLSNELRAYPQDMLSAPLDERAAQLRWTRGAAPAGTTALLQRDGRPAAQSRDRLSELISMRELTVGMVLLSLLLAAGLGALHAFSPGHGKTVVGAYLVGSRGTPRHAAFLGLTVTITHTLGVFALGLITLFASQYVLPERLFPILNVTSGLIVVVIGLSLFVRRLRAALGLAPSGEGHDHGQDHSHATGEHAHDQHEGDPTVPHSHGGSVHTHLPPGADGSSITWRSLLALGVSGGLLPCPSALVVLLAAISLHRVGFGLLLVVAFSVGLAATLTGIGMAFLYAGRLVKRPQGFASGRLVRVMPVVSAFVIMCVGLLVCYEALAPSGFHPLASAMKLFARGGAGSSGSSLGSMGATAVLGLGFIFGLKHATEVDHIVAVSTIVSERRSLWHSALVGGLWGAGHTASLVIVGAVVLALRIAIPESVANWLEFGVAFMIIGLGATALLRALRARAGIHVHKHQHDAAGAHAHVHFHERGAEHAASLDTHTHALARIGFKPLLVGMMHGLAGSAALTLLVLTQIDSPLLGLLYLLIFGVGSVLGMFIMSGLVGLPFALSSRKVVGLHYRLQLVAATLSITFGFWYAYETGMASGFWTSIL